MSAAAVPHEYRYRAADRFADGSCEDPRGNEGARTRADDCSLYRAEKHALRCEIVGGYASDTVRLAS